MRLELLKQHIRRNLENNIWNEKNRERAVVFRSLGDVQILLETENSGITDINTAQQTIMSESKSGKYKNKQLARNIPI
jgi:ribosomal protein L18